MRNIGLILCLLVSLITYAQEDSVLLEVNSLEQKLKNTEQPHHKIPILKEIIEKSFPKHPDIIFKKSNQLLELSKVLNNSDAEAFALFYLGQFYFEDGNFEKAKELFEQALPIYETLGNNLKLQNIYHNLGLSNQYLNQYDKALTYYQNMIQIAETIGDNNQKAIGYQDIGTLYNDLQKYSLAEHYYEKALKIYKEINNEERIAAIYQNIGVLNYNWGNLDQCLQYYKNSLTIYEKLGDKQNIAISLSNIGLVYEENKDFSMALDYYLKALLIFEEINFKPTLVYIFYNLGSLYRNLGEYSRSIQYFNKGLDLSIELSMKDYISYNYEALSAIYEELGDYKKSLSFYKEYSLIKDSLFNEEKHRQIEELEAKFQTVQHKKEIEYLKLEQDFQQAKLRKKENQNLGLIISSLLTLVIAFVLFILVRTQRKLNDKLHKEIVERINTEDELKQIKEELEIRVKKRTVDIEETNKKLVKEIEEHEKTMKSLEIAKDRAEEADRLKSNFLANVSHELRTPMNAISGFSQMLSYEHISANKRHEYTHLIQENCSSLTNLIDDIIDFAAIESGQINIEIKEFNPHPTLEFLYDHYTKEIIKRNKENLALSFANENSENDIVLKTDPSRLKQILSILIDNAIKFTEKGYVEFGFVHPNDQEIQFFVRDTGIGIHEKYHEVIFERFRQVDEKTTKKYGGAGIGLSVAKSLAKLLDGKIFLESTPGRGTTFYVNLPFNAKEKTKQIKVTPDQFNWKNKTLLIAEDKKINFEIFQETLSTTNINLLWAKNGQEAVDLVKENNSIDLILLDIQMPVMDGYECARKLKAMAVEIPIIAQTAYALPQDSYKCFDAGCDDYIAKPISLDHFLNKLSKYLS